MAKKTKATKTTKRVTTPTEFVVVKTNNTSAMAKAYNTGYRRVSTYAGGTVAVLRNTTFASGTSN